MVVFLFLTNVRLLPIPNDNTGNVHHIIQHSDLSPIPLLRRKFSTPLANRLSSVPNVKSREDWGCITTTWNGIGYSTIQSTTEEHIEWTPSPPFCVGASFAGCCGVESVKNGTSIPGRTVGVGRGSEIISVSSSSDSIWSRYVLRREAS